MAKSGGPLTRQRVLEAALRLLDQEGLEGFSMRGLGALPGVEAMSLYPLEVVSQDWQPGDS